MTIRTSPLRFRTTAAGAVAAALLALNAAPASAHTALKSTDPEADSEVAPPSEITLTFTEEIKLPQVVLTGPDGARLRTPAPQASGDTVTQPVNGPLTDGRYTVGWRVVSADGHPVTGSFAFTVKGSTPAEPSSGAATGGPAAPSPSPSGSAAPQRDGGSSAALWIGAGVVVLVLVAGGVLWARRPTQD